MFYLEELVNYEASGHTEWPIVLRQDKSFISDIREAR